MKKSLYSFISNNQRERNERKSRASKSSFQLPSMGTKKKTYNLVSFGGNEWGELCQGHNDSPCDKPDVSPLFIASDLRLAATGWNHSVFVIGDKKIIHAGIKVATGAEIDIKSPTEKIITTNKKIIQVACGAYHTLVLDENGKVFSWGSNVYGQLGHGNDLDLLEPKEIQSLFEKNIVCIAAGDGFSLALSKDGFLYSWGENISGVLGTGDEEDYLRPVRIEGFAGKEVVDVSAGTYHCLAAVKNSLRNDDFSLYSWGWNECGQLGLNDTFNRSNPTKVPFKLPGKIISMSCGAAHSSFICEIKKLRTNCLYMWGSNNSGQLGIRLPSNSKENFYLAPTSIPVSFKPEKVICGTNHTVIISSAGAVFTAGCNKNRQLGAFAKKELETESFEEEISQTESKTRTINLTVMRSKKIDSIRGSTVANEVVPLENRDNFGEVLKMKGKRIENAACGPEQTILLVEKTWLDDEDVDYCLGKRGECKRKFGVVNRKHHCRICGGIFCNECSSNVLAIGKSQERVCDECFNH